MCTAAYALEHDKLLLQPVSQWLVGFSFFLASASISCFSRARCTPSPCTAEAVAGDGMRLAAAKPAAITLAERQPIPLPTSRCKQAKTKSRCNDRRAWRIAVASGDADAEADDGAEAAQAPTTARAGRRARLSARRRERVPLPDGVSGVGVGEFLRHPDAVESLLNTGALESFAPAGSGGPGTFTCALRRIGLLGFEVAPVLDLRVAPTTSDCTIEMLSCRFEGSEALEQQNQHFSAFMSNHITWSDEAEEPCLDIDVSLEVTLEVYTKPFSMLPLSAVEKPGNLLMQGLLDRVVPMLGEQLLRDYHSWVQLQQQQEAS